LGPPFLDIKWELYTNINSANKRYRIVDEYAFPRDLQRQRTLDSLDIKAGIEFKRAGYAGLSCNRSGLADGVSSWSNLRRARSQDVTSVLESLVDDARAIIKSYEDIGFCNRDARPRNFIACPDLTWAKPRAVMLDLALSTIRGQQNDDEWGYVKHSDQEESAMCFWMQRIPREAGFEYEYEDPTKWTEYALKETSEDRAWSAANKAALCDEYYKERRDSEGLFLPIPEVVPRQDWHAVYGARNAAGETIESKYGAAMGAAPIDEAFSEPEEKLFECA
jgi:hypothetical protein